MKAFTTTIGDNSYSIVFSTDNAREFMAALEYFKKLINPAKDPFDIDYDAQRVTPIIFATRADAERVRNDMRELMDNYDRVSVADYYNLAGESHKASYVDDLYGWKTLGCMAIVRDRGGFWINLPPVIELK